MAQVQPSPEQLALLQQQMAAEAAKRGLTVQEFQAQQRAAIEAQAKAQGLTVEEFINRLRAQAFAQHQRQQQQQQQQPGQPLPEDPQQTNGLSRPAAGQPPTQTRTPIVAGSPDPRALALANWLKGQDLKPRACILNNQRRELFRVKRALRLIESPAYTKACAKRKSILPAVTNDFSAEEVFKLLPLSFLALRVSKIDPHEGHTHAPPKKNKKTKGLWTVKIEQQQDIRPDLHYVWLHEGSQWKQKIAAAGALAAVFAVVLFPLWPYSMRIGVWYLSMGAMGVIALFFAMAIVRLILFLLTMFTVPPGLWLYPNLFEDVGFFDSFKPVWAWHQDAKAAMAEKKAKRKERREKQQKKAAAKASTGSGQVGDDHAMLGNIDPTNAEVSTTSILKEGKSDVTASGSEPKTGGAQRRLAARVQNESESEYHEDEGAAGEESDGDA